MKIKLKYDSDYAEVARDLCDIAGLKCGDFRKKFQSYLEGMVRPALPPVSAKVLAGKIAESMAEKGFHRDCGNNDRLVIANELETLEEIVLLSAASGPRHPETLEYLGKRFELAGERRAPRKGEYWLGVVADPVSDSAFGPEMPIAPDKGIAVLATFDYASWNERQILRELPPLAPVEQPVIGGSVMVDPHGHQHAKTNQCQYSGCVEASPAPDSAAWWRQVAQRLAIKVHEYEHPASVAVSAVDFYDHWIMNVHQCKGKHGIRETAIEFAEAYHLQAAPSDWYLWAVAHMTALRNAICATIPEGEPFGDDALVAWPAKLNKKLKNAQAGTGWVLASRAREFTGALSVAVWDESAQEYFHDIGFCDDRGWHRRSERRGTVAYWQQLCPLPPPPEEPRI